MRRFFIGLLLSLGAILALVEPSAAQTSPSLGSEVGIAEAAYGGDGDTKSLSQYKAEFSDPAFCWGCTLFRSMARVTLDMGNRGEAIFKGPAIALLNAFMALWVTWQLYLLASPVHANGPGQTLDSIFQRVVLMMVLLFILHQGSYQYIMVEHVFPLIGGTMQVAQSIIGGTSSCGAGGASGTGAELVSSGLGLLCAVHVEMGKGVGLGLWLAASADFSILAGEFEIFQLIGGLIIALAFGAMMIFLPFRLFDAMIRIAVVSIILPVIVLAYQFKPTRGAVKQAVTSVLAAALTFLFTSIAVAICVALFREVGSPIINGVSEANDAGNYVGPIGGMEFMVIVAAAVGMAAFVKQAGTLASEFAGFQGQMGSAGSAGATAIGGAAAVGASVGGWAAWKAGGLTGRGVGAVLNKMRPARGGGGASGGGDGGAPATGSASLSR